MGYENRLYVVDYDEKIGYAEIIAMFNLCKTGYGKVYDLFIKAKEVPENFTLYPTDGNSEITEDCYGRRLTFASVEETIKAIKENEKELVHYRRFPPVIAFLESILEENYKNLIVVNYGY